MEYLYSFFWVIPQRLCHLHRSTQTYDDGTMFRNVGIQNSDAGESPKRKNTTFTTRRKFEIKYLTLIAFPLQQWWRECTALLRYTYIGCLSVIWKVNTGIKVTSRWDGGQPVEGITELGSSEHDNRTEQNLWLLTSCMYCHMVTHKDSTIRAKSFKAQSELQLNTAFQWTETSNSMIQCLSWHADSYSVVQDILWSSKTQRFITIQKFITASYSVSLQYVFDLRLIIILFFHLLLRLPSVLLPKHLQTRIIHNFSFPHSSHIVTILGT